MLPQLLFNEADLLAFGLILIRVSVFIVAWPVFSVYSVPNTLKILLAVLIAMMLFPVINRSGLTAQSLQSDIMWLALKEVLTGLCLGFLTRLFFFAVSIGGNLIATSIGMQNAQMFNPSLGSQSTTVEQFYVTVATLLFLSLNGHHYFLQGLVQSFDAIPLSLAGSEFAVLGDNMKDSGLILQIVTEAGIKIAAPVMVISFFTNVALGIVGRAVPQINVLVTGMPINFMAGMAIMVASLPILVFELDHQMVAFAEQVFKFMKAQ